MKKTSGFSLIELIVVITIIAVITVIGTVNYGSTNRKARDSRRMADIEKIRIALEMARQVGNTYPAPVSDTASALVTNFMSALPKDPKTGSDYVYARPTNYTYTVGTSMEDLGSTNMAASGSINYRISNP